MPQQSHGGPGSWRGGKAAEEAASPALLRFVFTVAVLVLIVSLIFAILKLFHSPRTLLGVVPISYSTDLPQNVAGQQLFEQLAKDVPSIEHLNWLRFQTASARGFNGEIAVAIAGWTPPARKTDSLIVYVSGHGLVRGETAYLLHNDFSWGVEDWAQQTAAVPAAELFDELQDCQADVKLVVIDSGRIAYDSRLGVVVNDFPRQLADEIKRVDDERLFVLLGTGPFESTAGMEAPIPSSLAHFLVEGLGGAADQDPPKGQIDLNELYRFVWNETRLAFGSDPDSKQTPILLQGGVGLVQPSRAQLASLQVVSRLPKPRPTGEETEEEEGDDSESDVKDGEEKGDEESAASEPQAARQQPGPTTQVNGWFKARPAASALALALLQDSAPRAAGKDTPQAGQPNSEPTDSAGDQAGSDQAAPTGDPSAGTASPQAAAAENETPSESGSGEEDDRFVQLSAVWQAWEALLAFPAGPVDFAPHLCRRIEYRLLRFDTSLRLDPESTKLRTEAAARAADLQRLVRMLATKSQRPPSFSSELQVELTPLAGNAQKYKYPPSRQSRLQAADSIQLVREVDIEINRALYRVRSYLAWQAIARTTRFQETAGALNQFLRALKRLESRRGTLTVSLEDQLKTDLRDLQLREAEIRAQIEDEIGIALQAKGLARSKRIGELLRLSCLTGGQRRRLRRELIEQPTHVLSAGTYTNPQQPELVSIPAGHADRIQTMVELELQAIEMFADKDVDSKTRLREIMNQKSSWKKFAQMGAELSGWYQGVVGKLQAESKAQAPLPIRHRGLLSFVDPRDVEEDALGPLWLAPEMRLEPRTARPDLQLVDDSRAWNLTTEFTPHTVRFTTHDIPPGTLEVSVSYPTDELEVQYAGRPLPSDRWRRLARNNGGVVSLELRAKSESVGAVADVSVRLRSGKTDVDRQVHCRLPQPNLVELVVRRIGSADVLQPAIQDGDVFALQCFPNRPASKQPRTTEFGLELKNASGGPKTIDVQLIRLPRVEGASWAPGLVGRYHQVARETRAAVFVDGDVAQGLKPSLLSAVVAEASDVSLGVGATEPVVLTPQAASAPAEGEESPPPPAAKDTSYGLLCLLTNKENPAEKWLQWLQVQALHPREYLDVEVVYREGAIHTSFAVKDEFNSGSRPPWTQELPGVISWEGEDLEETLVRGRGQKLIGRQIPPRGQTEVVQLSVDGYPRAFVFHVACRQDTRPIDSPEVMQGARLHRVTAIRNVPEGDTSPAEIPRQIGRERSRVIFPNCSDMRVEFAVDVPTNTFNLNFQNGDGIRLLVDGKRIVAGPYYSDRRVRTQLVSCEGNLTLSTTVSDYQKLIGGPTALNRDMQLEVKLPSNCDVEIDPIQLFVDTEPPTIRRRQTPRQLNQGVPLEFTLDTDDRGQLDKLELLLLKQDGVALPPSEPFVQSLSGGRQSPKLNRATGELQARHSYTYGLRVYDSAGNASADEFTLAILDPLPPPSEDAADENAKKGNIKGEVQDFRDKRVSGRWTLTLLLDKQVVHTLKFGQRLPTAEFVDGKFLFRELKPGAYTIVVVNHSRAFPKGDQLIGIKPDPPGAEQEHILKATEVNREKIKPPGQ